MFNRLKSKLSQFYDIFIKPPKNWRKPKKSEIVIYDASGMENLEPYLAAYSVEVISLRSESVNMPCLFRAILKLNFWNGKPIESYTDAFIEFASPKVVITYIDNNPAFYTISNRFPYLKTVFLQNGVRGGKGDVFNYLKQSDKYHVDYMLVFAASFGKAYKKYITGEVKVIGSFKNNHIKMGAEESDGSILFLSQYRKKPNNNQPLIINQNGSAVHWDKFYEAEVRVLGFLSKWCVENNKLLRIAGAFMLDEQSGERDLFAEHLNKCMWEYSPKVGSDSSYKLVDVAEIVVFIDSALGFESIGRGKKTAGLSCRATILNDESLNFGWPADLSNNGAFWTNDVDEIQFQRVMNYLSMVSNEEWELTRQIYSNELMEFDAGNTGLIILLEQLLSNSKCLDHSTSLLKRV